MVDMDVLIARGRARRQLPAPPARRMIREAAGVTRRELADVVGVSEVSICRYETGRRRIPREPALTRYVEALMALARNGAS